MKSTCTAKHTAYQPTDEEWKCPKCGEVADFTINNDFDSEIGDEDCIKLHDKDQIECMTCGKRITGKTFAQKVQKRANLTLCPHCKGKGVVSK